MNLRSWLGFRRNTDKRNRKKEFSDIIRSACAIQEKNGMRTKSPRETIRAYCLYCTGGQRGEVLSCNADSKDHAFQVCPFHPFRLGKVRPSVKIMRHFCLQCMGGIPAMVRECETDDCLIHPFRFGKNPARIGQGRNAEQMAVIRSKKQAVSKGISG